ncbi:MAG TPA: YCF48-related protein [Bacteroidia bacterium]|nr:YCF48-related protein [Bacteroidia bacterium]
MKKALLTLLFGWFSIITFSQSWLPLSSGTTSNLLAVCFTDPLVGYAVGQNGTIIKTIDGGINWIAQSSGLNAELFDVCFVSTDTGYIVGRNGTILKTTDGGMLWGSISTGTNQDFTSVFSVGIDLFVTGYNGTVLKSSDNGVTWATLNTGTSEYLYDIYFSDSNTGYAVGYEGAIIKTTDSGLNWTAQTSGYTEHLVSVYFTDNNNGYITGGDLVAGTNSGVILNTTDGGQNWSLQSVADNYLTKIHFLNATTGYVFGGNSQANTSTILKTIDAGVTWQPETTGSSRQYGGFLAGSGIGYSCGLDGTILKITGLPLSQEDVLAESNLYSVYPNPGNGHFTIQTHPSVSKIEITDALGEVVRNLVELTGTQHIDLSQQSRGIYFARFLDEEGHTLTTGKLLYQ